MRFLKWSVMFIFPMAASLLTAPILAGERGVSALDDHLVTGQTLVAQIKPENNQYSLGATPEMIFETANVPAYVIADCSSFLNMLLQYSYGLKEDDLLAIFNTATPTAEIYHDTILEPGRKNIFDRVADFRELQPGDILAIKYRGNNEETTGHMMTVVDAPISMPNDTYNNTIANSEIFYVTVLDMAKTPHSSDTRNIPNCTGTCDEDGAGIGTMRLFLDIDAGILRGYTWLTAASTATKLQKDNHMVAGRLIEEKLAVYQ